VSDQLIHDLDKKILSLGHVMIAMEAKLQYLKKKTHPGTHHGYTHYADLAVLEARRDHEWDIKKKHDAEQIQECLKLSGFDRARPGKPCPGCGVPLSWTKAHARFHHDSAYAGAARLQMGEVVGEDSMEEWLDCRECQDARFQEDEAL